MKRLLLNQNLLLFLCSFILLSTSCRKTEFKNSSLHSKGVERASLSTTPNIILILGDDIGYEVPTYTGGQSYSTPNLDNLAANGLQFTHCNGTPMCSPSRFMLLTGKYNFRNYFDDSWGNMGLDQRTIANMLQNAGYKTCSVGKWQFNNGDTATKVFGFDRYSITYPFKDNYDEASEPNIYKDPTILQDGAYLSKAQTNGKYSEDILLKYMFNFIDSNRTNPFFIYWATNLCHKPFSPTPDDSSFASWDPNRKAQPGDTIYFPSMVNYYDKEIGHLISKLQATGLQQNTVILLIVGDNGTEDVIGSLYNGKYVHGGKGHSYNAGIHLPLIAYCPGVILPGIDTCMVDFVDFMPTIADLTNTPLPTTYGPLDGISFYPQLFGETNSNVRQYAYCWYNDYRHWPLDTVPTKIWSLDANNKLYDGLNGIFDYPNDPFERKLISGNKRTASQAQAQANMQAYINSFKGQY
jgi:arylsulfatase A